MLFQFFFRRLCDIDRHVFEMRWSTNAMVPTEVTFAVANQVGRGLHFCRRKSVSLSCFLLSEQLENSKTFPSKIQRLFGTLRSPSTDSQPINCMKEVLWLEVDSKRLLEGAKMLSDYRKVCKILFFLRFFCVYAKPTFLEGHHLVTSTCFWSMHHINSNAFSTIPSMRIAFQETL